MRFGQASCSACWRSFLDGPLLLDIQETLYKGKIRLFGKTKGSLTKVPIAKQLAKELVEWRKELDEKGKDTSPDAFMFPGRFDGPMDSSNFRHRVLRKLAEELDLPKLTFRSSAEPSRRWARPKGT